mmetsp:Transcript_53047/g.82695  ORF Transcript_53047/g.82695 Transcript_53047/m.82695 type:complete len:237 (-) Transcript_53047:1351-2061(-)
MYFCLAATEASDGASFPRSAEELSSGTDAKAAASSNFFRIIGGTYFRGLSIASSEVDATEFAVAVLVSAISWLDSVFIALFLPAPSTSSTLAVNAVPSSSFLFSLIIGGMYLLMGLLAGTSAGLTPKALAKEEPLASSSSLSSSSSSSLLSDRSAGNEAACSSLCSCAFSKFFVIYFLSSAMNILLKIGSRDFGHAFAGKPDSGRANIPGVFVPPLPSPSTAVTPLVDLGRRDVFV